MGVKSRTGQSVPAWPFPVPPPHFFSVSRLEPGTAMWRVVCGVSDPVCSPRFRTLLGVAMGLAVGDGFEPATLSLEGR